LFKAKLLSVRNITESTSSQTAQKKHTSKFLKVLKALRGLPISIILLALLVTLFILSLGLGRYPVSADNVLQILGSHIGSGIQTLITGIENLLRLPVTPIFSPPIAGVADAVVIQVRLPRILAAMLVGSALSLAGGSFQGLFRNPLVSPDILGVSAGAGFGAALAIVISGERVLIQVFAFCFALLAVGIVYTISKIVKGNRTLSLVLAGLAISSLFSASLSLMQYIAEPTNQLPTIIYWLMGSLASLTLNDVAVAAIPILFGAVILLLMRWRFNVLAMGEEEAQALGVNLGRIRIVIIICCTLMSAAAVCISGIIGWVGLVIPHISRLLVGPDHKKLLPVSLLLGASYLLFIDDIARTASSLEIPLGVLTAMVGAPFFLYMLSRRGKGWA
jgi:iron complex transport system permease protein